LELGDRFYELDSSGRLHVDFPDAGEGLPSYSFATLLRGEVPDGALSGKIVLIGVKAVGIGDSYSTPFTGSLAGVEFLGAVLDNLIGERFLERRPSLDVAMVVLMGLLASLLWLLTRPLAIFFFGPPALGHLERGRFPGLRAVRIMAELHLSRRGHCLLWRDSVFGAGFAKSGWRAGG
jgi:hypothetical protein